MVLGYHRGIARECAAVAATMEGGSTALYCTLKAGDAVVPCSVAAAKLCAHLADWLGDTADPAHAPYPIPFEADLVREFVTWLEAITSEAPTATSAADDVASPEPKRQHVNLTDGTAFDGMDHNKLLDLARVSKWLDCEVLSVTLSSQLASRLRGLSPEQIREKFAISADMTPEEQESSLREVPETPPDAVVAPSPGVPPAPTRSLSVGLGDDDAIMELLRQCDLKTIAALKGVSKAWRNRARLALTDKYGPWIRSLAHRSPFGASRIRFLLTNDVHGMATAMEERPASGYCNFERPMATAISNEAQANGDRRLYKEWCECFWQQKMPPKTFLETNYASWKADRKHVYFHLIGHLRVVKGLDDAAIKREILQYWALGGEAAQPYLHVGYTLQNTNVLSMGPYKDIYNWSGVIIGPADSPYEGGVFVFEINVPHSYPFGAPSIKFITPILHPNIDEQTGTVCMDILGHQWSPAQTIPKVVVALVSLLFDPNFEPSNDSPAISINLAGQWKANPEAYFGMVRDHTRKHATLDKADLEGKGFD